MQFELGEIKVKKCKGVKMNKKKEAIAMILAGGQGSRLYALTTRVAKPAVNFGAKYRIIDFTLSNCINSGIDTVGVLTQYQPLILNEYIGNGQPWDLDRMSGGVHILPPYQAKSGSQWYKGTANAIYQNLNFIESYDCDYVVILSGDHIYKMDYGMMIDYHKQVNADCTIAVIDVPLKEASRFGIMNTDSEGRIIEFEEKPENPKSTKASMGIYVFSKEKLKKYLTLDEKNPNSVNDFGKNIIPQMLEMKERMFSYQFEGYWRDVGTIDSLWDANMDFLGDQPEFDIFDENWKIFSRTPCLCPQFISESASVKNSMITEGCEIYGEVENCLISNGVTVEEGAKVVDSIIMSGVVIKKRAVVNYSIIDENVVVGERVTVGKKKDKAKGITVIGRDVNLANGDKIADGEIVENKENGEK